MFENGKIYMGLADTGKGDKVYMHLSQANRHGLIAGASGTGKTVTMKVMAESFSAAGVPVFMCDIKGDVSGMCEKGADSAEMQERIDRFGIRNTFAFRSFPVTFWDIRGRGGHPVRATISDMGPEILSRILDLTEVQESVLNVIFRVADEKSYKILDLKDLKSVIKHVSDNRREYSETYGNMAPQSIAAITRALIPLENQGAEQFFGEPMLDICDWMASAPDGRGMINILHAVETVKQPKIYAMFLLWMMAELFETLPEVGDSEKPKMVFFFDEAHLLFTDAPKALIVKIEQTVKLIRSKGVGIYFVTQSPSDIPDTVLAQLSNRVQHALRAYTPAEQKAVKAAAMTFRQNPSFKTEEAIMALGTGEALTSFLDEKGVPQIVEQTAIICPESLMSPCSEDTRRNIILSSRFGVKYDTPVDSESAFEVLEEEAEKQAELDAIAKEKAELEAEKKKLAAEKAKAEAKKQKEKEKKAERRKSKLESQIFSTGGYLFRRGLLSILKKLK